MVQKWIDTALKLGFSAAVSVNCDALRPRQDVRDMCRADLCRAYDKNWSCPPHCGSLEECGEKIGHYSRGILLQTVGQLNKVIDTKGYRAAEQYHLELFYAFCREIRKEYPQALCLGTGGCRICESCAYPAPCRFPDWACSSMEGYGLFVTDVCREHGVPYYNGEKTVTYTACVLF